MKIRQKIRRFLKLSVRQKLLLITMFFTSLYTYILFRFFKHSAKFGYTNKEYVSYKTIDLTLVNDLSFAIRVMSKYVPWENVCRHQAYQALLLCRYYQIPYQVFIGFKKSNEGKIEGHAWTVVGNQIITGFCKPEEYVIQAIYS